MLKDASFCDGSLTVGRTFSIPPEFTLRLPAPEPVFGDGKDAFHRVPDSARNEWDAVERVLTKFRGARCVRMSGSSLPARDERGERREIIPVLPGHLPLIASLILAVSALASSSVKEPVI